MMRVIKKPIVKLMFRNRRKVFSLFITNPWIKISIGNVHEEIEDDNHHGNQKDHSLDDGKISLTNGLEDQSSHSRKMKHIFDDDRPCEKIARLKPADRHYRVDGISQGMFINYPSFGQTLALSCSNIIFSQNLKHGRPCN